MMRPIQGRGKRKDVEDEEMGELCRSEEKETKGVVDEDDELVAERYRVTRTRIEAMSADFAIT